MSLCDTFSDDDGDVAGTDVSIALAAAAWGDGLAATFSDSSDEAPAVVRPQLNRVALADALESTERKKVETRGRKPGTTTAVALARREVEDRAVAARLVPMTKSERARAGGKAKAEARKTMEPTRLVDALGLRTLPECFALQVQQRENLQIVPYVKPDVSKPLVNNATALSLLHSRLPGGSTKPVAASKLMALKDMVHDSSRHMSKSANAKVTGKNRHTSSNHRWMQALMMVLYQRHVRIGNVAELNRELVQKYGRENVQGFLWIVRYLYDEMSLRLRVDQKHQNKADAVVVKLINLTCDCVALWRVNDSFLRYELHFPTT